MRHTITRRDALAGFSLLPLATQTAAAAEVPATRASTATTNPTNSNRAVPFAPGDVVAGCTLLNDPRDDHRGRGRLLHYDANLQLKNTIWTDDTTHIVQGVHFGPGRTLWAFDTFAYKILRFAADGRRLPNFTAAPARGFGHVTFAADGRFFMGENYVGEKSRVPLRTTLPFMPGTKRLGEGHLFEFSAKGKLVMEHATQVHGGMGGFQGLTASAITPDGKSIVYTSESGPKVFHYDLVGRRQLPDVIAYAENTGNFFFDVAFDRAGRLLTVRGQGIDAFDLGGRKLRSYPLQSFGWASMSVPVTATHVYASNFFTGELVKLDLASGQILARADAGLKKSLSGVAEFPG